MRIENGVVVGCDKVAFADGKMMYQVFVSRKDIACSECGNPVTICWSRSPFTFGDSVKCAYWQKKLHILHE